MMIAKVTEPLANLPRGTLIEVVNIREDGSIAGYKYENQDDWTLYYVTKDKFVRVMNLD